MIPWPTTRASVHRPNVRNIDLDRKSLLDFLDGDDEAMVASHFHQAASETHERPSDNLDLPPAAQIGYRLYDGYFLQHASDGFDFFVKDNRRPPVKTDHANDTIGLYRQEVLSQGDVNKDIATEERHFHNFFPIAPLTRHLLQRQVAFYPFLLEKGIHFFLKASPGVQGIPARDVYRFGNTTSGQVHSLAVELKSVGTAGHRSALLLPLASSSPFSPSETWLLKSKPGHPRRYLETLGRAVNFSKPASEHHSKAAVRGDLMRLSGPMQQGERSAPCTDALRANLITQVGGDPAGKVRLLRCQQGTPWGNLSSVVEYTYFLSLHTRLYSSSSCFCVSLFHWRVGSSISF